jgi:hypothetical protein
MTRSLALIAVAFFLVLTLLSVLMGAVDVALASALFAALFTGVAVLKEGVGE